MITQHTTPQLFTPVVNPVLFTFDSSNKAQAGFRYVIRVRVGNETTYREWLIPPTPTGNGGGLCKFDASRYLSSLLHTDFSTGFTANPATPNGITRFRVSCGESYGGGVSGDMVTGDRLWAFNGAFRYPEFISYDYENYLLAVPVGLNPLPKLLTVFPNTRDVANGEDAFLYGLVNASFTAHWLRVRTYNSSNTLLGDFKVRLASQAATIVTGTRMPRMAAGWNMNDLASGEVTVTTGALPILDTSVAYYLVQVINSSNAAVSQEYRYNVVNRNCLYPYPVRLHFLNTLGGFDSFTFDLANKYNRGIESKTFKRDAGQWSGNNYVFDTEDVQRANYSTREKTTYRLISNYITDTEYAALGDLFGSGAVYMDDGTNVTFCRVVDSNYEQRYKQSNGLINLELTVELTYDNYRQTW